MECHHDQQDPYATYSTSPSEPNTEWMLRDPGGVVGVACSITSTSTASPNGVSIGQYRDDALAFGRNPVDIGRPTRLADGTMGTTYHNPGSPGGIFDANGRPITFWYN